jgi:ubiquinone/menaquinone biosynthesis C-methylase UbiE
VKKLNLGCGTDIKKGYVNLDKVKLKGVDVVHDIEKKPLPFKDNEFDEILANNIIEHIDYVPAMKELHRVLKKGGILKICVPHFNSRLASGDPTHKNYFSTETFMFFVKGHVRNYYFDFSFSEIKIKIKFPKSVFYFYNYLIEPLVNSSKRTQMYYESSPLRIFPSAYLDIELIK